MALAVAWLAKFDWTKRFRYVANRQSSVLSNAWLREQPKPMSERSDVLVYLGQHSEAVFLKSLLEGSGIAAEMLELADSGGDAVGVYVAQCDLDDALPLIEDFRNRGTKTSKFWLGR
jgi:hypothetical protein